MTSELERATGKLQQDFRLFEKTLDKIIFARIHKKPLDELIQELQNITDRIKKGVVAVKRRLVLSHTWSKEAIDGSNSDLSSLLTNYEITIARYKTYVDKFGCEEPLDKLLKMCTNYVSQLDRLLRDFNLKDGLKLLVPSKESEIIKIILNSGYQVVVTRDWGSLVVYR